MTRAMHTLQGAGAELRRLRERAGGRPLAIAHRAGNEPALLTAAEAIGADVIETDVWYWKGRVEVRHLKTLGRLPILWDWEQVESGWRYPYAYLRDRWTVRPGWRSRLTLEGLYELVGPGTTLLLDLKGADPRLPDAVVEAARAARAALNDPAAPPILICGRPWGPLEQAGRHEDVRIVYSAGEEAELAAVWDKLAAVPDPAVSIHARFLDGPTLRRFNDEGVAVITWPVNSDALRRDLTARGATGLTIDDLGVLRAVVEGAP